MSSPPRVDDQIDTYLSFPRDPVVTLTDIGTEADVVRVRLPAHRLSPQEYYVVSHPEYAAEVLRDQDRFAKYHEIRDHTPFAERTGLLTDDEAMTGGTREALEAVVSGDNLNRALRGMVEQVWAEAAGLDERVTVDPLGLFRDWHLRAVVAAFLDRQLDDESVAMGRTALRDFLGLTSYDSGAYVPAWLPTPAKLRFARELYDIRRWLDRNGTAIPQGSLAADLVENGDFSPEELRRAMAVILAATFGNDSALATVTLYQLVENPGIKRRVVNELADVADDRGRVWPAGAGEVPTLDGAIRESLRLYPPTFRILRCTTDDVTLGEYDVPEGARVWVELWSLGRDPRFWDDPESFDPDRWQGPADRPEGLFVPFGVGPRRCVGQHLAVSQVRLFLANLLSTFEVTPTDLPVEFDVTGAVGLAVDGPPLDLARCVPAGDDAGE